MYLCFVTLHTRHIRHTFSGIIMKFFRSCVIIHVFYNLQIASSNSCFNDLICIPSGYKKLIRPPPKNEPTDVCVHFKRIQISNIDENDSTITLKLTIEMFWLEPQIFISTNTTKEDKHNLKSTIFLPKNLSIAYGCLMHTYQI